MTQQLVQALPADAGAWLRHEGEIHGAMHDVITYWRASRISASSMSPCLPVNPSDAPSETSPQLGTTPMVR